MDETSTRSDPDLARPGASARRVTIGRLAAAGVLLVVAVVAWFLFGGERAQQSSEDAARQRLGSSVPGASTPGSTVSGAAGTGSTGSAPTSTTAPASDRFGSPPVGGLYRYRGSGKENTSFPPLTEAQGPQMPATVSVGSDGCWVLRVDYNTHHWQEWNFCTIGNELFERRGSTYAKRNFGGIDVENTSVFTCEPAVMIVGASDRASATHPRSCTGSGSLLPDKTIVAGTMAVVGDESLDVGGTQVPTVHVRYDLTYAGAQTGVETTDWWFMTASGLPARNTHSIKVDTDTPFGRITYTEDAEFSLVTPAPV